MEINLIIAGLCFLVYAFLAKLLQKRELSKGLRPLVALFHLIFFAGAGAVAGFFISSSIDLHGPSPRAVHLGILAGVAAGAVLLAYVWTRKEGLKEIFNTDVEWAETSSSAFLLAGVIMYCFIQAFKIPSGSMMDTLLVRDHLFVNKFIYGIPVPFSEKRLLKFRSVKRGDVIVFECPPSALNAEERSQGVHRDFIKRAIAIPGDIVRITNKQLYINGVEQQEPYVVHKEPYMIPESSLTKRPDIQELWETGQLSEGGMIPTLRDNFGPFKIPEGHYLALGDNRDQSFDSRFWGPLPAKLLKGKAWFVYWPLNRIKVIR